MNAELIGYTGGRSQAGREPAHHAPALLAASRVARAGIAVFERIGRSVTEGSTSEGSAPRRRRAEHLHALSAELCDIHGLELVVRGRVPDPAGAPVVLVANHLGWLDPIVIGALLPCAPIASQEVQGWPLVGTAAARFGAIFVHRAQVHSGARALRQASAALGAGVSVLDFPEGVSSDGDRLRAFHRGIFGVALRTGSPVVPVALRLASASGARVGGDRALSGYARLARRPRTRVTVHFGEALPAIGDAETLSARAWSSVSRLLAAAR